jgi:hypothetical protein
MASRIATFLVRVALAAAGDTHPTLARNTTKGYRESTQSGGTKDPTYE